MITGVSKRSVIRQNRCHAEAPSTFAASNISSGMLCNAASTNKTVNGVSFHTLARITKAFAARAILQLIKEEGLDLDVVSGGELAIARSVAFPMERVHCPGNNKSVEELNMSLDNGIGHIVVDNLHELNMLREIAG